MASEELDTRSGQLFNIAVAGNSIATTWTGDPSMPSMPGDSVYMLLVAEVMTITENGTDALDVTPKPAEDLFKEVSVDEDPSEAMGAALASIDEYVDAVIQGAQGEDAATKRAPTVANYIDNSDPLAKEKYAGIAGLSQDVRSNKKKVKESVMSNFRWRRSTSSYLAANSGINLRSAHSRCGLGLGFLDDTSTNNIKGQWIVGAWRIGTVLDNAASRAGAPSMGVRTAPSSYAISVNVNVQWVSSDELFRRYDGRNVGLVGRGEAKPEAADARQYAAEKRTS